MKDEVKEAIEAIRLHALWMSGRMDELTPDKCEKELILWGGIDGVERGERLSNYINIIDEKLEQLRISNNNYKDRISVFESGYKDLIDIIEGYREKVIEICDESTKKRD